MSIALAASSRRFSVRSFINKKFLLIVPLLFSASAFANCPDPAVSGALTVENVAYIKKVFLLGIDERGNIWKSGLFNSLDIADIQRDIAVVSKQDKTNFYCKYKGIPGLAPDELKLRSDDPDKGAIIDPADGPWGDSLPAHYFCAFTGAAQCAFRLENLAERPLNSPF